MPMYSMATDDRFQRRTTPSGGVHQSDPRAWCAWAHRGHRLWAAMPAAFWLYVYKVQRCPEMSSHDWKACPYAHIGERARRRDPRRFPYLAAPCAEYLASRRQHLLARTGAAPSCARGLWCRQAHGSFELWLHPARFRTRMCERGVGCPRPICFFAHFPAELRGGGHAGRAPPVRRRWRSSVICIPCHRRCCHVGAGAGAAAGLAGRRGSRRQERQLLI
ncbi:hypothetical protein GQ55_3G303700 [Panicum hallii var. hallii]|uniref:AtC3H23-like CCCH zinc finger domain-containing protein n=1 Tax=Panicum hallii var. hallii TaxID=1504633 RepID=A0A2T7EEY4_9POAL|nr:hypothetical protein GQ55_3G303700 [Panicum hallii var. hallii]